MKIQKTISNWKKLIDTALKKCLRSPRKTISNKIYQVMQYAVFSGGKRIRPLFTLATAYTCELNPKEVLPVACAIELIHTYSLIHDDLPSMDNDDYRRGKLTVHKKFNVGLAILAGDALLTKAFNLLSFSVQNVVPPQRKNILKIISTISKSAGADGMIGGQVADTFLDVKKMSISKQKQTLNFIHTHKTADLIQASIVSAGIFANVSQKKLILLKKFGFKVGLVFQIIDDVFDKDKNKLTYPKLFGIEKSKEIASNLIKSAKTDLSVFGNKSNILKALADYVVTRKK